MIVLEAKLRLIDSPQHRSLVGLGYRDAFSRPTMFRKFWSLSPIGLEGFEGSIVDGLRKKNAPNLELIPEGRGFLLVEFGSNDPARSRAAARQLIERMKQARPAQHASLHQKRSATVWKIREAGARSAASAPGARPNGKDGMTLPSRRKNWAAYLRDIRKLLDEYNYHTVFYGHFGHGCIHMRVSFDLESEEESATTVSLSSAPRISWWVTAARFQANMATGNPAVRCFPKCSAPN